MTTRKRVARVVSAVLLGGVLGALAPAFLTPSPAQAYTCGLLGGIRCESDSECNGDIDLDIDFGWKLLACPNHVCNTTDDKCL
jgi:hypothetical protein